MIIAEFTLDHPMLRHALDECPDAQLTWENSYITPQDQMQVLVWFESADFDALDDAIANDPSVTNQTVLTTVRDRRLYRFDVVEHARTSSIMPLLVEHGATPLELTADHEGWWNRVRFPDRDSFERVYQYCQNHDVGFSFHRVFDSDDDFEAAPVDLTDGQREILIRAVETGYLDIPRRSSLDDLAADIDISESAASERFRRAVRAVVEQLFRN